MMSQKIEGWTEIAPGLFEDQRTCEERGEHRWESGSSVHDTRHSRICRQCGKVEWGARISEQERASALASMAVIQNRLKEADGGVEAN